MLEVTRKKAQKRELLSFLCFSVCGFLATCFLNPVLIWFSVTSLLRGSVLECGINGYNLFIV